MQVPDIERDMSAADPETERNEPPPGAAKAEGLSWVTAIASAVSALAVVLMLLGYGTSLAVESRFGLPHALMFESALDLTHFASVPLSTLLSLGPTKLLTWQAFWDLYAQNSALVLGGMALWLTVTLSVYLCFKHRHLLRTRQATAAVEPQGRRPKPERPWLTFLALGLVWPAMPILMFGVVVGIVLLASVIAMAPVVGMLGAERNFDDWVLRPARCVPVQTHRERLLRKAAQPVTAASKPAAEPGATCVVITKDGKPMARGRVVLASSKAVVLYDPATGFADRVPVDGAMIRSVGSLDDPLPWPSVESVAASRVVASSASSPQTKAP